MTLLGRKTLELDREARDVDAVAGGISLIGRVGLLEKIGDVRQNAIFGEGQILLQDVVLLVALREIDEDLGLQARVDVLDRKSTRLNSSH